MPSLALLGLLLCRTVAAQIFLQDGSTNSITKNNFPTSITNTFTVTPGASVLVVSTYVQNNLPTDQAPSLSNWGSQSFTKIGGEYNARSTYASSDIFYLTNPAPGTHNIIATNTPGGTVTAMAIQVYTLNGVDTSVAPSFFHTNKAYGLTDAVILSGLPAGAWAAFSFSWGYNGAGNTVTSTSGALGYGQVLNDLTNYIGQAVLMGGVANLAPGNTTVRVANPNGGGVQSALAVAVFAPAAYTAAPTNLVATGQQNQVALSWNDASGGAATNYIVLRSTTSGGGYTSIGTNTSKTLATFTDTNVVNYVTYYYVVQAVGPAGLSRFSTAVSAIAVGVGPAPTGLLATPLSTRVGLIWNPQADATVYHILRATGAPTSFTNLATSVTATYTDSGLVNGTTYYYEVAAENSYGTSANSAYVSATPAPAASGIALHDGGLQFINVGSGVATISTNFVVTQGANMLVVELWDFNHALNNSSPGFMSWSNATLGSVQKLTRAVSQNCQGYNYSDCDIFYLFNPAPGYGVVSGTDLNSAGNLGGMTMQVYTWSGVDTNVVPATYSVGNGSATSLSVATAPGTASGSWAAVLSYNANTGGPLTNSASSGTSYYINNSTVNAMGYVANLAGGSSTVTAREVSGGGATLMALAVAVFSPAVAILAPTNVMATAQADRVVLTWNDASGGAATGYIVFRSTTSGSGYTAIATNSGNASVSYTDTNVISAVAYYYVVEAVGAAGTSPYSLEVSAYVGLLPAPTGLTAAAGNGVVGLTWNALAGASYNVLRATSNPGSQSSYTVIASPAAATYTDTGVANGMTYYYEVNAVNGFGTSAPSAYVSATPTANSSSAVLTEIRSASPTVLVAFFKDPNWSGPVWGRSYSTNQVDTSNLSLWTLNGTPVTALDAFITEANAVDYHIYLHIPPLVNGTTYMLVTPNGSANFVFDDTKIFCESIKVNQSGYSALSHARYANLAIWLGSGGSQPISGPLPAYTVFSQFTGQPVASGTVQAYGGGALDSSSGDYVYRIDLSSVPEGGPYKVSVSGYGCSHPFGVGGDFSRRLGYVAFRALYYNRCGCPIVKPYAWADIRPYPCHTNIYDSQGPSGPDTFPGGTVQTSQPKLFVHGGHHDAADSDRRGYHLLMPPVLMTTYEAFPNLFTDKQFNIPDQFDANYNILGSGNGIPDILDQAMWMVMFWTNVQSTPNGPPGAVAWGSNASGYTGWGINDDQDSLLYGTETNNVDSCTLAAGVFMHMARLIKPYNAPVSTNLQARGDAAYNYASSHFALKNTHKLYFAIQKYLLTGDLTASNNIQSLYTQTSQFPGSYNKQTGGFLVDGSIWMASYFMSYVLATNNPPYPLNPTIVNYFCTQLKAAADNQVSWTTNAAYPSGWRATDNPASYNYSQYYFTAEGQMAYPCLMQWALTRQQKYIDTVSLLMDYIQGLNPLGKCYMTGLGFEQTHNPQHVESAYAEWTMGWGGPMPGITVYGPGPVMTGPNLLQVPTVSGLARERKWMDDCGSYQWTEFTVEESELFPAVVYPVLAQGGPWSPAREPFLNPIASISVVSNGFALTFGGLPGQTNFLQVSATVTGPWSDLAGPLLTDSSGTVHFTVSPPQGQATQFYRTRWAAPIY